MTVEHHQQPRYEVHFVGSVGEAAIYGLDGWSVEGGVARGTGDAAALHGLLRRLRSAGAAVVELTVHGEGDQ